MELRISKYISECGVASRRTAEDMILAGRITVDGKPAELGQKIDPEVNSVELDGKKVEKTDRLEYIILNKPRGYVTTLSDEQGRRTVAELTADLGVRVYPVGRLDLSSEGLLIMTNDGALANGLMHPSHSVDKEYVAWVTECTDEGLSRLSKPFEIDGYRTAPAKVRLLKNTDGVAAISITIHEGRNRQVRRICEMAGMHVNRLRRIREGNVKIDEVPNGKWRRLTEDEVRGLYKTAGLAYGKK